jgi:hypothetical protein
MVIIGAALPIAVAAVGAFYGVSLRPSISAYYWAAPEGTVLSPRDVFVGCLCAIAACLWLYKGFSSVENAALNLAGMFAVGVAVFPTAKDPAAGGTFSIHGTSAVLLFLCLVFVVWFCAGDTLKALRKLDAAAARVYRDAYRVLGLVMLVSPITAFFLNWLIGGRKSYIFFVETLGIEAFAAYWFFKGRELAKTQAIRRALRSPNESSPEGVERLADMVGDDDEPRPVALAS